MNNDLVSIIMLSKDKGQYVRESIECILAQTYQNWELLFIDDNSKDDTISRMMDYLSEDKRIKADGSATNRIQIKQTVFPKGYSKLQNSALKDAKGKWIAFLNAGDLWRPDKLERQIAFMKENKYALSYTEFDVIDKNSKPRGIVVSGPEIIDEKLMTKCYWPGLLTVMYDRKKIGRFSVPEFDESNSYALLLILTERADCHLLRVCLASNRTKRGTFDRMALHKKLAWRYEAYRVIENVGRIRSALKTVENLWYTVVKRVKYVRSSV